MIQALEQWSDEALADEAKGGSSACFELLVRRYQTGLLAFLQRSLNRADAEDVLQETFIQIYAHLDRYNNQYRFKAWAFVITRRLMIDRLRQIKRLKQQTAEEIEVAIKHDPSAGIEQSEQSSRIWSLAKKYLDDQPFQALWLHYAEELDTHEIAHVMQRSWVWVKTSLFRSRRKLKPYLEKEIADFSTIPLRYQAGEPCQ